MLCLSKYPSLKLDGGIKPAFGTKELNPLDNDAKSVKLTREVKMPQEQRPSCRKISRLKLAYANESKVNIEPSGEGALANQRNKKEQ